MLRLLIVARESRILANLRTAIEQKDCLCSIIPLNDDVDGMLARYSPDLLLVELSDGLPDAETLDFARKVKRERALPVIALVAGEMPDDISDYLAIDDFLASPYDARELAVRVKRLLQGRKSLSGELIKAGSLVIDVTNCDVTVGGQVVELTFKEYELLKLLAANRGRVFTRDDLLNKVWGYEYFGGDRTVDVHIRRLRSKIEGPGESFIETVRNIGYRFRKDG